ncbi:lycopene cyclase domain-containing protein [Plantibacter sp. VKM Ac-2880]|uniref:lycopene cyclase domain-containing protein n=1 Tax=Plantibacter sp. VKM Ac-2880 TaxID=2783827 RepID=UPI00188F014A|nr:lycopene cyclase domain-containing protein [Plantibacter sp. VKM Ac-2880]MBF4567950.1 lycopene cyclase domain-containing protein [Plantibacter sp. VKM Ac-2880]
MTYAGLNAWFLAVVAVVALLAVVRMDARRRRGAPTSGPTAGTWLLGVGGVLVVLLLMTALFDNVMIGIGLVGYDPALISGAFIGVAPLEDFAYAIAAAVLLPSLWVLLERRAPSPVSPSPSQEDPA